MYIHLFSNYIFLEYNYPSQLQNNFYTLKRCGKDFNVFNTQFSLLKKLRMKHDSNVETRRSLSVKSNLLSAWQVLCKCDPDWIYCMDLFKHVNINTQRPFVFPVVVLLPSQENGSEKFCISAQRPWHPQECFCILKTEYDTNFALLVNNCSLWTSVTDFVQPQPYSTF